MMAPTHHLLGASFGLSAGIALTLSPAEIILSTGIAALTGGGILSPDIDQFHVWRFVRHIVPLRFLGKGGPLQHRGITHYWVFPILLGAYSFLLLFPLHIIALSIAIGWLSHLFGDWLFGKASPYDHRGPGIPLMPWWAHHGVGLKVDGRLEHAVCRFGLPVILAGQTFLLIRLRFGS